MNDLLHRALKLIDHNRGAVVGLMLAALICAAMIGCEVATASLVDPGRQVNAQQLEREIVVVAGDLEKRRAMLDAQIAAYNSDVSATNQQIAAANADLQRQVETRQQIVATLGGVVTDIATGTLNPASTIAAIIGITSVFATGGLMFDNRRKDRLIRDSLEGGEFIPLEPFSQSEKTAPPRGAAPAGAGA